MGARAYRAADESAVAEITRRAFEKEFGAAPEVELLRRLREETDAMVELVAEHEGRLVGHIAATPALGCGADGPAIYCLGPMAIDPDLQRRGFGGALVDSMLEELWRRDVDAVVLIGHPGFYTKCGFREAVPAGFTTDFEVPSDVFLVATRPGGDPVGPAHVVYASPFYDT